MPARTTGMSCWRRGGANLELSQGKSWCDSVGATGRPILRRKVLAGAVLGFQRVESAIDVACQAVGPGEHEDRCPDDERGDERDARDLSSHPLPLVEVVHGVAAGQHRDAQQDQRPRARRIRHDASSSSSMLMSPVVPSTTSCAPGGKQDGVVDGDDRGYAVLAREDGQMGKGAAGLRHQSGQAGQPGRESGLQLTDDQHIAGCRWVAHRTVHRRTRTTSTAGSHSRARPHAGAG